MNIITYPFRAGAELIGGLTGSLASSSAKGFFDNLDFSEISRSFAQSINNGSNSFASEIKFSDSAQVFGKELGDAIRNFSFESIQGLSFATKELRNVFLTNLLPTYLGVAAISVSMPLCAHYIYHLAKHSIGRPKLATVVKIDTYFSRFKNWLSAHSPLSQKPELSPIFNSEVTGIVREFSQALRNSQKNGGFKENMLLYGPGGTGKTMIAKTIAEESGFSYVQMSGGDLAQYIKRGEHVTELNKLMEMAKSRPTILFIDEVESLARDRSQMERSESLELLNAFLNHTGEPQKNLAIIAATNLPDTLDAAFENRMDRSVYIGSFGEAERKQILENQMEFFFSKEELTSVYTNYFANWLTVQTEGFTGRTLVKMVNAIKNRVTGSETNQLTGALIQRVVGEFRSKEKTSPRFINRIRLVFSRVLPLIG